MSYCTDVVTNAFMEFYVFVSILNPANLSSYSNDAF